MNIPEDQVGSGSGIRAWVESVFYGADAMAVTVKLKKYFNEYPPQGYDTQIMFGPQESLEGFWYTRVRRYSTCS